MTLVAKGLNVVTLLEHSTTIQYRHPKEYLHFRHHRNSFLLPVGYCFTLVALLHSPPPHQT